MIRLIGKKGKKMDKKTNFVMTDDRKKTIKQIKKDNVKTRFAFIAASPLLFVVLFFRMPISVTKKIKKGKNITRELLRPFGGTTGFLKEGFQEGTQKLMETYKNFADDDKKSAEEKAEAQRKRQKSEAALAANKRKAEEKGIPEIVELVKTKTAELKTDSDHIFVLDNGVEVILSEYSLTVKESEDNQCTISLNDYEYGLFGKAVDLVKFRLEYQKNRNMREKALGLLNKEKVRK